LVVEETGPSDVERLGASLGPLPEAVVHPFLVVVSGLPGTGKSYFSRRLVERLPAVILESDQLRKTLFPAPGYSAVESRRLFRAAHVLVERLLRRGVPVVFDATNLSEHYRGYLYRIAERLEVKLVLVRVEAPAELVYQRLQVRRADTEDWSDADWGVYQRLRPEEEKIRRRHYVVDTSRDIGPVISKIVREIRSLERR
jgi:predicted kinase